MDAPRGAGSAGEHGACTPAGSREPRAAGRRRGAQVLTPLSAGLGDRPQQEGSCRFELVPARPPSLPRCPVPGPTAAPRGEWGRAFRPTSAAVSWVRPSLGRGCGRVERPARSRCCTVRRGGKASPWHRGLRRTGTSVGDETTWAADEPPGGWLKSLLGRPLEGGVRSRLLSTRRCRPMEPAWSLSEASQQSETRRPL